MNQGSFGKYILAVLAMLGSGCASWAPGLRVDESAVAERAGKSVPGEPGVIPVTPAVVAGLVRSEWKHSDRAGPSSDASQNAYYEYRIAPFDILSVTVWDHPELTIPAGEFRSADATGNPVRADGTVFYPYVGVVQVGGKTVAEARELLTERIARVVKNPQLDVRVVAFRGKRIQVTGEVIAPSTLPITDVPLRAQDAIAQVKGITPEADLAHVLLSRKEKTYALDLFALYERGDVSQNWLLEDGDVLHVPRSRVFILGEVRKQQAKAMTRGHMTLADAIGDAEGLDMTSASGVIYVIRGEYDRPTVYRLDAASADALLLAVQFPLRPADVIFFSATELTRWNRVMSQILPTVQALWQTYDIANRTRLINF